MNKKEFIDACISSGKAIRAHEFELSAEQIEKIENALMKHNDSKARRKIKTILDGI
jgi:hypothetical protein